MCCWCIDAGPANNSSSSSGHGPARSRDRNERGETAMHVAAIKGDQEGIKKLLEQGMSPNVPDFAGKPIAIRPFEPNPTGYLILTDWSP